MDNGHLGEEMKEFLSWANFAAAMSLVLVAVTVSMPLWMLAGDLFLAALCFTVAIEAY
jgi:hypothetical protein